jgi:aminoglycoside/choline kinase family phosphotransferase
VKEFYNEMKSLMDVLAGSEEVPKQFGKMIDSVQRIPGDASTRRYYRISALGKTFIAMQMEVFSDVGNELPFLTVQRHLAAAKVDVPQILDLDPMRGYILLEDLGDVTLLRRLQEVSSPDVERHLYERVLDSLIQLQIYASPERAPSKLQAYQLRFDHEKLMWEMGHTIEHFYELHLKREIGVGDKKIMMDGLSEICTKLAAVPTVLAHRDFHSRNIMVTGERLVMIDFQDARMGPAQYDLVSLLKDSYYQLEESQIANLLQYYIARFEAASGKSLNSDEFIHIFDLMSIQRNFKAIGSFASFLNRRGNATYLKYIGNTFENIRRTLLKYPQYSALREVLFHYYYF